MTGLYNVERTDCPHLKGNARLMLGMSTDMQTAQIALDRYRERYPHMTFRLASGTPRTTCDLPPPGWPYTVQ